MKEGDLERLYREAGRDLRELLFSFDLDKFNADEADMIRRRVQLTIAGLNLAAEEWVNTAMKEAGEIGARKARVALEILGKKPVRPQITDPGYSARMKALETMVRANNSIVGTVDKYLGIALVTAHKARTAQVQEFRYAEAAAELDEIALKAMLEEKSRGALQRQLVEFLRALLEADEFIEINGRNWKMSKYAKMVARTEIRKAQTDATLDLCRQYENDLVEVSDHGCDCDECEQYEGNIYSVSGTHPKYPPLGETPPYHPSCKHSLLPTSEEAVSIRSQYQ